MNKFCLTVLCFLPIICILADSETYVNKFAVHIEGGERVARSVADTHGFIHLGQIGDLTDHYLFEHPHVERRSTEYSHHHHQNLASHPHVRSVEQQKLLSRKKRDFLPIPDDIQDSYSRKSDFSYKHHYRRRNSQQLVFNDELYSKMWYFHEGGLRNTDMNVQGAWQKGVTGKGVVITILDDGIEKIHDDLKDNYDPYASYDVNAHDNDPSPRYDYSNENRHGTRCAGEVSAKANNTKCIVGVAYDSRIGGVRMLDGDVYDAVEAASLSFNRSHIDIYSASWGPDDDGRVVDGPGEKAKKAFIDGVTQGRNGKGSIFVWASGNGGNQKDSCNCDGYTNSVYTLSISSISQQGKKPWYLEECSSTLATTYSSGLYSEKQIGRNGKGAIFVWASGNGGRQKDSCSCDGYTNSIFTMSISGISQHGQKPFYLEECASTLATTFSSGSGSEQQVISVDLHNKCTTTHTGTSASAPLAAGIVALILEVKPSLTWRDVQYITLMTARPIGDGEWETNGVGRKVSVRYGYGLMDATAMVELAEKWTNVPEQHICEQHSDITNMEIPDNGYEEYLDIQACAGTDTAINYLEHVQAKMTIQSKRRGDLVITLTSPMGTRSTILPQRPNDGDCIKGFNNWKFLSTHFWGENPAGRWKLEIGIKKNAHSYFGGRCSGTVKGHKLVTWSLILHGTLENPVNLRKGPPTPAPPTSGPSVTQAGPPTTTYSATTAPPVVTTTQSVVTTSKPGCHMECEDGCTGPGPDQCKACRHYKIEDSGICVSSCPNNYYLMKSECKLCDSSCETCTTISASEVVCLSCKPGYLLMEGKGKCKQSCEQGYYKVGSSQHCRVCSGKCLECEGSPDRCTACRAGMELFKNRCLTLEETCPADQYMQNDGTCQKCPSGCISCSSDKNCTCCSHGSYLKNGNCVQGCGSGYLPFHVNYSDELVFQQCQQCDGVFQQCQQCDGGNCVQGCGSGYLPSHVNYSDELVFQQCQQCDGACNVCPEGFNFINSVCVQQSNCPEGHYFQWNSMTCKPCNSTCKSCIGPSNSDCLSCYPPLGYNNLLRRCMNCCIETSTTVIDKTCCKCIEDGKCELPSKVPTEIQEIKKQMMSVAKIIMVLVVVVIVAVVIIVGIVIGNTMRKKLPYSDVGYQKLLANEKDVDFDKHMNSQENSIIQNGTLIDAEKGDV